VRPSSILWFERLYLASLALTLAIVARAWEAIRAGVIPPTTLLFGLGFAIGLPLVLTLLVSRRRSVVAKWVLVAIFTIGLIANGLTYRPGARLTLLLVALSLIAMQAIAVALLFMPSARAWLGRKNAPAAEAELRETFD
jgi:hypothetical protein